MRRVFGRGAAAAAVFAVFLGGFVATPALAMESDSAPVSISDIDTLEVEDTNELDQGVPLIEELALTEELPEVQGVEGDVPVSDDLGTNDEQSEELEVTEDAIDPLAPLAPDLAEFDIIALEISGIPAVGQTLTSMVEFSHEPDSVGFQWFADDDEIEGAVDETLVLTEAMVGKTIVLGVYAENDEFDYGVEGYSDELGPVTAAIPVPEEFDITKLEISGVSKAGQTLTSVVEFSHAPDYVEFQWFADEDEIEGADGETLVLTEALVGKTIVLGVYAENDELDSAVEAYSNELGPVTTADLVIEDNEVVDLETDKVVDAKKPPTELAETGVNSIGAVVAGLSLMLLGAGALLSRRRVANN